MPLGRSSLHVRDSHPLWCNFPDASVHDYRTTSWSYYPACALPHRRFGLFPVRSPLLGESLLFSSPAATKMFQFAAFAPPIGGSGSSIHWVAPFGDRGIKGHLHLPRAYRSLSRPSSPSRAKASACCPFLLLSFCSYSAPRPPWTAAPETCSIKLRVVSILRLSDCL